MSTRLSPLGTCVSLSALVAILAMTGCGGGADDEARALSKRSIIRTAAPLSAAILTEKERSRVDEKSVKRALLDYWSYLQYQAWSAAGQYYEPGLRGFLGEARLEQALESQADYFRSQRPVIVSVSSRNGNVTTTFLVRGVDKDETPSSLTWRRVGARWQITHDPHLAVGLGAARQREVQMATDPTAKQPSGAALAAGRRAERLPAEYATLKQRGRGP